MMGKYIYGIINSNTIKSKISNFQFPISNSRLPDYRLPITDFGEIYTIPYLTLSAVVGDSGIVNYTHMNREELARLLVGHQKVIERIMELGYAIIPMRLGTFAVDEEEVVDILGRGYSLMKEMVDKISDKIEIDITATWSDFGSTLKEIGDKKEIKELKDKLLSNPEGLTVGNQIKMGELVKKGLDNEREKYASQIQDALKSISQDFRDHELMDDKMVINMAFLINKTEQREFDRKVEELNTKFNEKLNFRCIGPLPPYSFYTLEIKKMEFEEVDWARRKLGLDDVAPNLSWGLDKVKKAYKRAAASTHPDRNPDRVGTESRLGGTAIEFDDVSKAYKIVVDYCEACEQTGQGEGTQHAVSLHFNREEFKNNAILVKVLSYKL